MAKETGIPLRAEMHALVRSYGLDIEDVMSVELTYDCNGPALTVRLVPTDDMVKALRGEAPVITDLDLSARGGPADESTWTSADEDG